MRHYQIISPERANPGRVFDLADLAEAIGETAIIINDAAGDLNRAHFRPGLPTAEPIRRAKQAVGEMLVKIAEFERDQLPVLKSCAPGA